MPPKTPKQRFLTIDELMPGVDVASCSKFERDNWFRYRLPAHHMMLIESGRIDAKTSDGLIHGKPGDLFCLRPTEWSEYTTLGPTLYYQAHVWFASPPRFQATPTFAECGPLPTKVSLGRAFPEMRVVFETICIEVTQPGTVHQLRLRTAVHEMLAIIAGILTRDRHSLQHLDEWQRLRMRLDADLNTDISVDSMARQMNLTSSYFNHAFKQRFGATPKAYHTHARLREAARLLRFTDKPVKTVAYEMGFTNARTFTRLFRNRLGVLPSDMRMGAITPMGVEISSDEVPRTGGRLFPMNKALVSPQAGANWEAKFATQHAFTSKKK